jgi:hypothetical protein
MTSTSIVAGIVTAQNSLILVGICKTDFGGRQLENFKEASRLHTATKARGKKIIVIVAILRRQRHKVTGLQGHTHNSGH